MELFEAIKIPTKTGELVHKQPLKQHEGKFLIVDVLSEAERWTGYDEDRHCINSFIAWDLASAKKEDEEDDESSDKENLRPSFKSGKEKKKTKE